MEQTTQKAGRPARTDALRNEERLVATAREVFADRGVDAPLEDIAKQTGVGIGTLYRHFPTRQHLVESVLRDEMLALAALGETLLAKPDAVDALRTWLESVISQTTKYLGQPKCMAVALRKCSGDQDSVCDEMAAAGGKLLERAQASGQVRADVNIQDVVTMINAMAWSAEQGSPEQMPRLINVMLNGLRP